MNSELVASDLQTESMRFFIKQESVLVFISTLWVKAYLNDLYVRLSVQSKCMQLWTLEKYSYN